MSTYCLTSGAIWCPRKLKTDERWLMCEKDSLRGYWINAVEFKKEKLLRLVLADPVVCEVL